MQNFSIKSGKKTQNVEHVTMTLPRIFKSLDGSCVSVCLWHVLSSLMWNVSYNLDRLAPGFSVVMEETPTLLLIYLSF